MAHFLDLEAHTKDIIALPLQFYIIEPKTNRTT